MLVPAVWHFVPESTIAHLLRRAPKITEEVLFLEEGHVIAPSALHHLIVLGRIARGMLALENSYRSALHYLRFFLEQSPLFHTQSTTLTLLRCSLLVLSLLSRLSLPWPLRPLFWEGPQPLLPFRQASATQALFSAATRCRGLTPPPWPRSSGCWVSSSRISPLSLGQLAAPSRSLAFLEIVGKCASSCVWLLAGC